MNNILIDTNNIDLDKLKDALNIIYNELLQIEDINSTLSKFFDTIIKLLNVSKGAILVYNHTRASLELIDNYGFDFKKYIKSFEDKLYLKISNREINEKIIKKEYFFIENLFNECPDFVQKNLDILKKEEFKIFYPLIVRNKFFGVILLGQANDDIFNDNNVSIISLIVKQICLVLTNFQLTEELKKEKEKYLKRNAELADITFRVQNLSQISVDLSTILKVDELLDSLLKGTIMNLSAKSGIILELEEPIEGECDKTNPLKLKLKTTHNIYHLPKEEILTFNWEHPFSKAIEEGNIIITELNEDNLNLRVKYSICVPLKVKDPSLRGKIKEKTIGLLAVFDKESREVGKVCSFDEKDEALVMSIANQGAILWENAKLYEDATLDGLTKLYVRRFWDKRLYEEVKKAIRFKKTLSLMMIDIDHFKKFNDTYGHQTGDKVLKLVAEQISKNTRQGLDIAARYGGEELSVIMPETELTGAINLAERLREAVYNTQIPNPNPKLNPLRVSISLGVSTLQFNDQIPLHIDQEEWNKLIIKYKQTLLEQADMALYTSKREGRNRVTAYKEN